jgi:hypothetical protein
VKWTARDKESNIVTELIIEYSKLIVVWGIIKLDKLTTKMAKSAVSRLKLLYYLLTAGTENMYDVSQSGQLVPLLRLELGTSRIGNIIFTA